MLNNLLDILPGDGSWWAGQQREPGNYYFDNFGEAAIYALIGFVVVFVGIVILIGIIWLIGYIMRKTNDFEFLTKMRSKKEAVKQDVAQTERSQISASNESDEIPDEVKAAIVAAIMAYYQEKEDKCQFTVKRIKRI